MNQETTKCMFCENGIYTEKRQGLHNQIMEVFYNTEHNPKNPPEAIILGGGSASGKSTLSEFWLQTYQEDEVPITYIDCDAIKGYIPEYKKVRQFSIEAAAFYVHDESSDIAQSILERCINEKKNFLYDGTMKNLLKYKNLIEKLIKQGYHIVVTIVDLPIDIAKERAHQRFLKTGRKVPDDILTESHKGVPGTFLAIKDIVHEYTVYDTSGIKPVEIAEKTAEHGEVIYDEEKLKLFYKKSDL